MKLHDFVGVRGLATTATGTGQGRKVIVGDLLRGLLAGIDILLGHAEVIGELGRGPFFFDGLLVPNKEIGKLDGRIAGLTASCACHGDNLQKSRMKFGFLPKRNQIHSHCESGGLTRTDLI